MRSGEWGVRSWLRAARPRTVLLSFSGVLMGGSMAFATTEKPNLMALVFCAITAMALQILSNLANDYGDYRKGADDEGRVGPQRVLQSGLMTESQMRKSIVAMAMASLLSGALLIFVFARLTWQELAVFGALGLLSVLAALLYTLGRHPYGYHGLGDLFCFLFFGWAAVFGTYYLATKNLDFTVLLPASAMGFLSVAVLNINNMRDYENDRAKGKTTLVVILGLKNAFRYHVVLIVGAFACLTAFLSLKHVPWWSYAFWLLFPLFAKDLITLRKSFESGCPDYLLPKQVIKTFLLTLVFGIMLLI